MVEDAEMENRLNGANNGPDGNEEEEHSNEEEHSFHIDLTWFPETVKSIRLLNVSRS